MLSIALDIYFLKNKKNIEDIVLLICHIFMIVITIVCYFLWRNYYGACELLSYLFNGTLVVLLFLRIIFVSQDKEILSKGGD